MLKGPDTQESETVKRIFYNNISELRSSEGPQKGTYFSAIQLRGPYLNVG